MHISNCSSKNIISLIPILTKAIPIPFNFSFLQRIQPLSFNTNRLNSLLKMNPCELKEKRKTMILRFQADQERCTFSFNLPPKGKIYNFDRNVQETITSFEDRIRANVQKKWKKFDGEVNILLSPQFGKSSKLLDVINQIVRESSEDSISALKLQVGEEIFEIDLNPPEVNVIKFGNKVIAGCPILPIKIETSSNVIYDESLFKWEYLDISQMFSDSNLTNSKKEGKQKLKLENKWEISPSTSLSFIPPFSVVGSNLRFTMTPSNGIRLGESFSITTNPVVKPPVDKFLFEHRGIEAKGDCLRVVSYNILADACATPEWFTNRPEGCLDAEYRVPLINKELLLYNPDILCLQEVDQSLFETIYNPFLKSSCNLEGIFSCKFGNIKEGVAIFFNKDKFSMINTETVILKEFMQTLPFWDYFEKNEKLKERLLDRNTILQATVLQSLESENDIFIVATTHLYFHPNADHIRLYQTIASISFLESKIKSLEKEFVGKMITLILGGDFNCTPPFASYRLLTSGEINDTDEDWSSHEPEKLSPGINFSHQLNLRNSHPNHELTNIVTGFEGCIDYILFQEKGLKLRKIYPPLSKETIGDLTKTEVKDIGLPNNFSPSDHFALIADFKFNC